MCCCRIVQVLKKMGNLNFIRFYCTVRKYSDAKRGKHRIPWNKGKSGCQVAWNKGVKNLTHKGKAIVQLTLNDEKIKEYEKIKDAAKEYGINERFISKCCRGIISEYKGYKWKFKDER